MWKQLTIARVFFLETRNTSMPLVEQSKEVIMLVKTDKV